MALPWPDPIAASQVSIFDTRLANPASTHLDAATAPIYGRWMPFNPSVVTHQNIHQ